MSIPTPDRLLEADLCLLQVIVDFHIIGQVKRDPTWIIAHSTKQIVHKDTDCILVNQHRVATSLEEYFGGTELEPFKVIVESLRLRRELYSSVHGPELDANIVAKACIVHLDCLKLDVPVADQTLV